MADTDEPWKSLPLEERLKSTLWKARKDAYGELKTEFMKDNSDSENALNILLKDPESVKKMLTDSNVAAQDSGVETAIELLKYGAEKILSRIRSDVTSGICEKALISNRETTRKNATEVLLLMIELDKPEPVVQEMVPFLSSRMPKLITAIVRALNEIYTCYGCVVVDHAMIIDHIPKLFAHADKNVRAETTKLSITLRSYIGDAFEKSVFANLKPIQQKDLTNAFSKISSQPQPTRLLKVDQAIIDNDTVQPCGAEIVEDIEMTDYNSGLQENIKIETDPWEIAEPIDILKKIPLDFYQRLLSSKWKERVEVLKEVLELFEPLRLANSDYTELVKSLAKALKDVNIYVVITSCEILFRLGQGIRNHFERYVILILEPLLDRTKEKKKSVTDALGAALDVCFKYSSLNEILQPTIDHMNHKTPQIKYESMQFLLRCLRSTKTKPSKHEVNLIMEEAIKLLSDSQLIVRDTSSEVIGTLMKIIGSTASNQYMEKVDKRHQKRIEDFASSAVISFDDQATEISSARINQSTFSIQSVSKNTKHLQDDTIATVSIPQNKRKSLIGGVTASTIRKTSESVLPSKRGATSPLKKDQQALTSKSLRAVSGSPLSYNTALQSSTVSPQESRELEELQKEKQNWINEKQHLLSQLENYQRAQEESLNEVMSLNEKIEDFQMKFTNLNVTLRSKEAKMLRLQGDLDNSRQKEILLDQRVKYLEQQLSQKSTDDVNSSFERKSNEINNKISTLSIDHTGNSNPLSSVRESTQPKIATSVYDIDDNDESWKRATAVTNDLKAKIQRMKARTRVLSPLDE